ncbi:MAG: dicarboxylate/amino acid:cation symporter, partial [Crocinitomicaceae bacterium]|nr:dicarboxylate/amino acid:cation symporter [Crocinitomicaceae bacterium]
IAPLVFSTLVVGIAKLGDIKAVGRIGGKALGWFFTASFISLVIGLFWVNILKPGLGLNLSDVDVTAASEVTEKTQSFSVQNFVEHIIPKSIFEAMAMNEILQIVIFSIFFGLAAASIGDNSKPVISGLDKFSHIILKMVNYVMKFAPIGVFGAIAGVFAVKDVSDLMMTYTKFFSSFLVGITSLWIVLLLVGYLFLGKRLKTLLQRIVSPLVIAFGTTSSEAVFPKLTEELERFGIKDKIVSFMLPLGYSFNLDGSMMYMTFASMFIAQAYGVHLDLATQMTMLIVLMLTSKGIAGVPRASLVVVAATCGMFNIPIEGIALILPIDHFCDMFRSATNVLGNSIATSVVGQWEQGKE